MRRCLSAERSKARYLQPEGCSWRRRSPSPRPSPPGEGEPFGSLSTALPFGESVSDSAKGEKAAQIATPSTAAGEVQLNRSDQEGRSSAPGVCTQRIVTAARKPFSPTLHFTTHL